MDTKDSKDIIVVGLALGAIFPVAGFVVVETIFGLLTDMGLMEEGGTGVYSQRTRTMGLLAICFNLIPFNWAKNKRYDNILRGTVFPTLAYVGFWLYKYADILF